jgi:hypothetical protein
MKPIRTALFGSLVALCLVGMPGQSSAQPELEFSDLTFHELGEPPGLVEICFTVYNVGNTTSPPELAQVRAAELGAFLEWVELLDVEIPPLQPGESIQLCVEAANECHYQNCPANELCFPDCGGPAKVDRLGPNVVIPPPPLPPPPPGVFPCPPVIWGGNIDIFWNGAQQAVLHLMQPITGALGHPTYVHVCIGDFTMDNYTWALSFNCPGWSASFVAEDMNGNPLPGTPMGNPINNWGCGYICVTPNPTTTGVCNVTLTVTNGAGATSTVTMNFDSSLCQPTQTEGKTWGEVKGDYR